MQPKSMEDYSAVSSAWSISRVIGIIFCLIRLLYRFVGAHERVASALEIVARKMKDAWSVRS
jgi:hypothetical protein